MNRTRLLQKLISGLLIVCGVSMLIMSVVMVGATEKQILTAPVKIDVVAPSGHVAPAAPVTQATQEEPVKVIQSGPVTFTLPISVWVAWLVSIATGMGAIAAIGH